MAGIGPSVTLAIGERLDVDVPEPLVRWIARSRGINSTHVFALLASLSDNPRRVYAEAVGVDSYMGLMSQALAILAIDDVNNF